MDDGKKDRKTAGSNPITGIDACIRSESVLRAGLIRPRVTESRSTHNQSTNHNIPV